MIRILFALFHFIFTLSGDWSHYSPHFTDEEMKAQKSISDQSQNTEPGNTPGAGTQESRKIITRLSGSSHCANLDKNH